MTSYDQLSRRTFLQAIGAVGVASAASAALVSCGSDSDAGETAADTDDTADTGSGGGETGGSGPAAIRFAFYGSDDRVRRFTEAVDHFNDTHPTISAQMEFGDIDAIRTRTTVAMAGGNLPDVFWVIGDMLPQLGHDGHVMDLGEALGNGIDDSGFEDSILGLGQLDGTQYTIPHGLQSIGLFANQRILDEHGVPVKTYPDSYTWEEYAQYGEQISDAAGDGFFGTDEPTYTGAHHFLRAFARQRGENLFSDDGDLGFTEDTFRQWLEYWHQMRSSGAAITPQLSLEQNPFFEGAPMIRGLAAFHMRNSNQLLELQSLSDDKITLMPCPGNGGAGTPSIGIDANLIAIAADSQHPDAAVEFLDYLLNDPERAEIIGTTIGAPPTQRSREHIAASLSEPEAEFLDHIDFEATTAIDHIPLAPETQGDFNSGLSLAMERLAFEQISIDDAIAHVLGELQDQLTGGA